MPLRPKFVYTMNEAITALGLSRYIVERLIREGTLPAARSQRGPRNVYWAIRREDLIKFMKLNDYPPESYRGAFGPPKGALMWLGKPPDLDWSGLRRLEPVYCRSAYRLGKLVGYTPTWGIVIDTSVVKGWLSLVREIVEDRYAPLLIALTEGPRQTSVAAKVFDLVLPRPLRSAEEVAQSIIRFRSQKNVVPRMLSRRGTRFRPVTQEK